MRIPLLRFAGDERPIEPWEERIGPFLIPIILPVLFALVFLRSAAGAVVILGWAVASPVLPRPHRLDWRAIFHPNPSANATCPGCGADLELGPIDRRGHIEPVNGGGERTCRYHTAICPGCGKTFGRHEIVGKRWSGWRQV